MYRYRIVRRIGQMHAGRIAYARRVGAGASLRFTLPENAGAQPK
jgi:signal transduction histidine kinase